MLELTDFFKTLTPNNLSLNLLQRENNPQNKTGKSYLKVTLTSEVEIAIAMKDIVQVLVIPSEKIAFLPNLPNYVIGLFNQRNRVFWLIKLSSLLQLKSENYHIKNYEIVIIKSEETYLGLEVEKVNNMIRLEEDNIKNISQIESISSHFKHYFQGYILEKDNQPLFIPNPYKIIFHNE
jgi:twitching motility protein PilI